MLYTLSNTCTYTYTCIKPVHIYLLYIFDFTYSFWSKVFDFDEIGITSSWFQSSINGQYHDVHNHGSTGYSAVCFVDLSWSKIQNLYYNFNLNRNNKR